MYDTRTDQNLGVLDDEDEEMEAVNGERQHPGDTPPTTGSRRSADEQRIIEVIEGRGSHEGHPGGPGVGGD
jgi:hypothetical protein